MRTYLASLMAALVLILPLGLSASAAHGPTPDEQLRIDVCAALLPFFSYAYQLHDQGIPEEVTQDIVAYHPELDAILGYPVYLGIKALYSSETTPRPGPYLYATQLGCIQSIGLGFRPDRVDGRLDDRPYYHSPRKDA